MMMYTVCVMFSGQGPIAMMMYTRCVMFSGQGTIAMMIYTRCDVQQEQKQGCKLAGKLADVRMFPSACFMWGFVTTFV